MGIVSGRDTNLQGAQLRGDTIKADVGRDLNIVSQQDKDIYHSQQDSAGIGVSLCIPPFCYGSTVSVQGNVENGTIDSIYKSVNEQSGFYAGKGGYDIQVGSNTDLKGAVIASAVEADKNKLSTGTLTTSDIQNKAEYSSSNSSLSGSLSSGVGLSQNVLNNAASNFAGNSLKPQQGNAESTTRSAISEGSIIITDSAEQKNKTGKTVGETIAGINHDTANASAPIDKIFDLQKIQRDQEVAKATSQLAQQVAPLLYEKVGDWLQTNNADTPAKVAVHALIGGLMTKAMGGEFGTGAAGAAAAKLAVEVFGNDIANIDGLSKPEKDALTQLLGLVVAKATTQFAGGADTDGNASGINAKLATEFNYLKHDEIDALAKARKACTGDNDACKEVKRLEALDKQRDVALDACSGVNSFECNDIRKNVRQAAADIIRHGNATWDLLHAGDRQHTVDKADGTLSGVDRATEAATGYVQATVDGVKSLSEGFAKLMQAATGGSQAQEDIANTLGNLARLKNPEVLAQVLNNASTSQREAIAQAYENGDAFAIGKIAGNVLAMLPVGAGVAKGSIALEDAAAALAKSTAKITADTLENTALKLMAMDAGAIKNLKSADEINALMKSYPDWSPAWQSGTTVAEMTIKPGTKVKMVVDEATYNAFRTNSPDARFGGWATLDNVPNQAYARDQLAITSDMKSNVGYVIDIEVIKPINAQIGVVGAQGAAKGGGNQLHFIVSPFERNSVFKFIGGSELR